MIVQRTYQGYGPKPQLILGLGVLLLLETDGTPENIYPGPFRSVAGQAWSPGSVEAEGYRPGAIASQGYTPGSRESEGA